MISIAICDDNIPFTFELDGMVQKCIKEKDEQCEVAVFNTGEGLIAEMSKGNLYDIIFLDIELQTTTGIEVGKYIRTKLKNEEIHIAYISSKTQYAMQLFQVRPIDFIVKPISYAKLLEVMNIAYKLILKGNNTFEVHKGGSYQKVFQKEILFFESDNKKISIHCVKNNIEFYGKLSDVANQLKGKGFLHIHKSYLVNYEHVAIFEYDSLTLTNEVVLPISQSKRSDIRKAHLQLKEMFRK